MKQISVANVLMIIVALALAALLYFGFETYEEEIEAPWAKEAIKEPYLAAKMLLSRRNTELIEIDNHRRLFGKNQDAIMPNHGDVLIYTSAQMAISVDQSDRILNWIEQGGELILFVTSENTEADFKANALINDLGVGVTWDFDVDEDTQDELDASEASTYSDFVFTELRTDDDFTINVRLNEFYRLVFYDNSEPAYFVAADQFGTTFAQYEYGHGFITFIGSESLWNNYWLDEDDNALLLAYLTYQNPKAYVVTANNRVHWIALLYSISPYFVILFCLSIALFMWHLSMRFGPINNDSEEDTTRFSDHIRASGEYYWRTGQQHELINALREAVNKEAERRWPHFSNLTLDKRLAMLSEITGWKTELLSTLMQGETPNNENQFTQTVVGLSKLRKHL